VLSQAAAGPVVYDITTANATATNPSGDYVGKLLNGETIPAGQVSRPFTVTIKGDTAVEADETFTVRITAATGATLFDAVGLATIVNDDAPP
jgi:hypothetical protein